MAKPRSRGLRAPAGPIIARSRNSALYILAEEFRRYIMEWPVVPKGRYLNLLLSRGLPLPIILTGPRMGELFADLIDQGQLACLTPHPAEDRDAFLRTALDVGLRGWPEPYSLRGPQLRFLPGNWRELRDAHYAQGKLPWQLVPLVCRRMFLEGGARQLVAVLDERDRQEKSHHG